MMDAFKRILDLTGIAGKKSLFLFGPRQTGKTFLLRHSFPDSIYYNLLLADEYSRLSLHPSLIRDELTASNASKVGPVIIDEIQKLPLLLDEVHNLIEEHGFKFILTGSSARKLKRGGANLLGGRAWIRNLFPLVFPEILEYNLLRILNFGALPHIYASDSPIEELSAYCGAYLKEEIAAEGAVRRIENFSRFLQVASLVNAELVNFESVSRDTMIPARTIRDYFTILEDTLLGSMLMPHKRTVHRKAVSAAKFYMFDIGVSNYLAGRRGINTGTELFGKCFEHLIYTEIKAMMHYTRDERPLTFWRDYADHEIDFIIGDETAIEVKSTEMVCEKHLKSMKMISGDIDFKNRIIVSLDRNPRKIGNILILPWKEFLVRLWQGAYSA